tara:strand:- start:26196 stop:29696 length:3501 start_codon:yes stop_codon:yes gene_type:complete
MSGTMKDMLGYLPSIKTHGIILNENSSEMSVTLELSAIDTVDKNGNLFWGSDYDFSQYIKYSIFLQTNADSEQDIYNIIRNPEKRISHMMQDLRRRGAVSNAQRVEIGKMSPTAVVSNWVSGIDNTTNVRSQYGDYIFPIEINASMGSFLTDSRSNDTDSIRRNLSKYKTVDSEGKAIIQIPAVKTFTISKSDPFYSNFAESKFMSCYIFSIFDFQQLVEDENINNFDIGIADKIGSVLTYDLILKNGSANDVGNIMEYFEADPGTGELVRKIWTGNYHERTLENEGGYIGFQAGTAQNPLDIKLTRRIVRNVKVQDMRGVISKDWSQLGLGADGEEIVEDERNDYSLISGTDEVANFTLPNFSGENPKSAQSRFINYYKNVEMQKFSQGNSVVYGKMILDQTSEGYVNYLFMIDFFDIYMRNSRFAKVNRYLDVASKTGDTINAMDAVRKMVAPSIKVFRRKVKTRKAGTNSFGYADHEGLDEEEPPYLVAEISQIEGSTIASFTSQISNNSDTRDDTESRGSVVRQGTLREINLRTSQNNVRNEFIKSFTGTDFSVDRSGGATYQYYVEIGFIDNTQEFYLNKYKQLLIDINYLETLYETSYQSYDSYERKYDRTSSVWQSFVDNYRDNNIIRLEMTTIAAARDAKRLVKTALHNIVSRVNKILSILYNTNSAAIAEEGEDYDAQAEFDTSGKVTLLDRARIRSLLSPFNSSASPDNQLTFLRFLNHLKTNYGLLLDIDNIPSHRYTENSATSTGNDTGPSRQFTITNFFPEYITPDNTRSYFNLAYFGDIFEDPGSEYGIPVVTSNDLSERIDISADRFVTGQYEKAMKNEVVLEPMFFNSSLIFPQDKPEGFIFHREQQNPINVRAIQNPRIGLSDEDLKNIASSLYQSGLSEINFQTPIPVQKKIDVSTLKDNFARTNIKKSLRQFEKMYTESMREFANELGISLYADHMPMPTALLSDVLRGDDSNNFINELSKLANLSEQKTFFIEEMKNKFTSELGVRAAGSKVGIELIEKFSNLFESMLNTDHDRFYGDLRIDVGYPGVTQPVVEKFPAQIKQFTLTPRHPYSTKQPKTRVVFDTFKIINILNNVNTGDNIKETDENPDMQDFIPMLPSQITNLGLSENEFVLLSLEQYENEDMQIGYSKLSKAPVATKYVLMRGGN